MRDLLTKLLRKKGPESGLILVMIIFLATSFAGLDFGVHWDERFRMIGPIVNSLFKRAPLPGFYWYPSLTTWLGLMSLIPASLVEFFSGPHETLVSRLQQIALGKNFLLTMRAWTVLSSLFTLTWIYLWVREWRKNKWEAVLAAALTGASWEFAYHSRWFTVDPYAIQFTVLTLYLLWRYLEKPSLSRLAGAGAAAGLAAGSKYTAGLVILPVLAAALLSSPAGQNGKKLGIAMAWAAGGFLLTTPGALMETKLFTEGLAYQQQVYTAGHSAYSVSAGMPHLRLMASYLAFSLFSPFSLVSASLGLLALVGLGDLFRIETKKFFIFMMFPIAIILLLSIHHVMIVRNILVVLPFLSVLAARGATILNESLKKVSGGRFIWTITLATCLFVNEGWLIAASRSIANRNSIPWDEDLKQIFARHPNVPYFVSLSVAEAIFKNKSISPVSPILWPDQSIAVFYDTDIRDDQSWSRLANKWTSKLRVIGPLEVNYNYYPTWAGDRRIILLPAAMADQMGVQMVAVSTMDDEGLNLHGQHP